MFIKAIVGLTSLVLASSCPQYNSVYNSMSTHRVCCCNNIGILTDLTTFNGSVTAPCKTDFEKMYEGKANVIRVDSIEALNSCSVVFFGVVRLQGASSQIASLYPSYDNHLGTGSAAALNVKLNEYVKNGGKVVAIGDTVSRTTSGTAAGTLESNLNTMNSTFTAFRGGVSTGLTILPDVASANLTSCTQANLGCSCGAQQINRYWTGRVSVPSGDPEGDIFKSSEDASEHWISAFGVGHSSGGVSLTSDISASFTNLSPNTCTSTSATLRPFAYEKIEKGYIIYIGDRNMFAWQRSLEGAAIVPNLTPCGVSNTTFPTTIDCFTGPAAEYSGLNVYEANKFFLWSLLKACSSC
jgi:hypothetical protein